MPDRRVVFYSIEDIDRERPFDRLAAARPINDLDDSVWVVPEHRLLMAAIVDRVGTQSEPTCLRFLRIRDDRPFIIGPERQPRLIEIEQDYRVTDFTYAMLWSDGFMAAISSRDAPNIKYLSTYFRKTSDERCQIVNLYARDIVQQLRRLKQRGLTKASVKIGTAEAEQIEHDENLPGFRSFWVAGRGTEAATIEVTLSIDRKRDTYLANSIADEVERLASYGDLLDRLIVTGEEENGKRREINLKQQRIYTNVSYEQNETSELMYSRLASARREVEDEDGGGALDRAARLG